MLYRRPTVSLWEIPSMDHGVILRSVHLRADFGLRSMDALHLATALVHDYEPFVTNDRRLARVDRLRVQSGRGHCLGWTATGPRASG